MADRTIRSFKNRSITSYHDILTSSPILTRICLRIALEGMWQLSVTGCVLRQLDSSSDSSSENSFRYSMCRLRWSEGAWRQLNITEERK